MIKYIAEISRFNQLQKKRRDKSLPEPDSGAQHPSPILPLTRLFLLGDSSASCDVFRLTGDVFSLTGDVFRLTGDVFRLTGDVFCLTGVVLRLTGVASVLADDPLALSSSSLTTTDVLLLCLDGVAEPPVAADRFLEGLPLEGLLLPTPNGFGMSEYSFDFSYSTCENKTRFT